MRIELAKLLLQANDVLLLDEPTNHLDIESIIWLVFYVIISAL
jgi:ATP-binding cassette subfamily F protein 3